MSLERLLVKSATVLTRGPGSTSRNEYGRPIEDTVDPQIAAKYPCWLEQTASQEIIVGRETVLADWLLILPPEAIIDATDQVVVDGQLFEVVGHPDDTPTPRGPH